MDFRPLGWKEQQRLVAALKENVEQDRFLKFGKDTSFAGTAEEVTDEEVIAAIKSVPCHYSLATEETVSERALRRWAKRLELQVKKIRGRRLLRGPWFMSDPDHNVLLSDGDGMTAEDAMEWLKWYAGR